MARTRSVDFLPEIFKTPVNKQFLAATLDQMLQEPKFKKTQGFIGRTVGPGVDPNDKYVVEPNKIRQDYQLEPGIIGLEPDTNKIKKVITYPGMNDAIGFQGGNPNRPDQLYNSEYYTWDPFVDYDAFVNFSQYFWVPGGPQTVEVKTAGVPVTDNFVVTRANGVYTFSGQAGNNPTIDLVRGGNYTFQVAQNNKETVNYRVTNSGTSSYLIDQLPNPTLTLARGNTYVFNLTLNGLFPFWIKTAVVQGTGDAYNSGVTRNGSATGLVTFTVPQNAPDTLYYVAENQTNFNGVINIVNGIPGTGPGFWIQTNPGTSGVLPYSPNINDRDVVGVVNNGEDLGVITFNVPQRTAQQFYYDLADVGPIDLLTTLDFDQINNQPLDQFIATHNGIDGVTYLDARTLVFVNDTNNGWVQTTLFDPLPRLDSFNGDIGSYDSIAFDLATAVPFEDRYQVWQINIVERQGVDYINLTKVSSVNPNQKFTVLYGATYSSTNWYKLSTGYFKQIPLLTALLDELYYQDSTDPEIFGRIRLLEQTESNTIFVEQILGATGYTSPNGVVFTNGLKVKFTGDIVPASYGSGTLAVTCVSTVSGSNYVTCETTVGLYPGEEIIFTASTVGIVAGQTYYIKSISANGVQFSISTVKDGAAVALSTATYQVAATAFSLNEYYVAGVGTGNGLQNRVGFVDGRAYFGAFHVHRGQKMTGAFHTASFHQFIYNNVIDSIINAGTGGPTGASLPQDGSADSAPGTGIYLIPVRDLVTPESYVEDANDSTIATEPGQLDYLTIDRGSQDLNAWTRSNRWFHTDVLQATANYNNTVADLDNNYRAKRPIISFRPGVRLYNMGVQGKQPVDMIDFAETDALSNIEGSTAYSTDGYTLVDGSRVIFAADLDPDVRNNIYVVQFITPDTSPPMSAPYAGPQPIIHLTLASDGEVLLDQSTVCLYGSTNPGETFWYDGVEWTLAQQKTAIQQAPLFNIYDLNGISFGNRSTYPSSTFVGSKLFSYAVGDTTILDPILQFPLQYLNINNVGDIVFENNLYKDTFLYVADNVSITTDISAGAAREYVDRTIYKKLIGWQTAAATSQQYQQFKFTYTEQTLKLDIAVGTTTVLPPLKIYVGSNFVTPVAYTYTLGTNSTTITLSDTYLPNDIIEVLALSDQTSNTAFYQVPINLENNPLNGNSANFTLGTIRTQYETICENLLTLVGPTTGANNTRDLGNIGPYGLTILQQSAPLTLAGYFLRSEKFNIFASLQYNSNEYLKFKGQMLNAVTQLTIQASDTTSAILDTVMADITLGRVESQPFYWGDMLPAGMVYQATTYTVSNTTTDTFDTIQIYNYTAANYLGMNVYLNNVILTRDLDYVVATDGPRIAVLTDLVLGDVLLLQEYSATYGTFVPSTPTKMGLYPAFRPEIVQEKVTAGTQTVIVGHDGSITKTFGDIRDDVLLEFETRIFNNIKLDNNPVPIELSNVIPGQFRTTGYSIDDINAILATDFLSYVAWNKLDYKTQNYQVNNEFSWNYSGSQSRLNNKLLPGAWRGIYRYYYDTQQPQLTPWEMLGLSIKPNWWDTLYGVGPYTQDNLVLWDDIAAGYIADPVDPRFASQYARPASYTSTDPTDPSYSGPREGAWAMSSYGQGPYPQLQPVVPTADEGALLSPFDAVVGTYNDQTFRKSWSVGDGGPVEASWWNSSAYPFAAMRLLALTRPAKFFTLFADRDLYKYNNNYDQYLYNNRYRLNARDIEVYGNGISKASYINWIVDYNRQSGLDSTAELTADLDFLDVRLCYRMASFSDKQYIKIYTEKSSPNSVNTTLLIPDESYDLLLYKNQPFERASYSAVVIQQVVGGYAVFGYSTTQPFFNVQQSQFTGQLQTYSVAGITVQVPTFYTGTVTQVPYGYIFADETAVSAFLLGYGKHLEQQGLIFDDVTNNYILSWNQMVTEFLYWSQQGWDDNALINLNPLAFRLQVTRPQAVVDSVVAQTSENIILDQNRQELATRNLVITRIDNTFVVEPATDQTLSNIDLKYTSYEHMIVLNNASAFGDLIYQPITGARQSRLTLIAATTTEWNGSVDAQGFILNQDNVQDWSAFQTYTKGEIVKYKGAYWSAAYIVQPTEVFNANDWLASDYTQIELGLLPNLANKANQLQNSYNINTANLESDNDLLSYGLIGFRPRQYMASLNLDDVTQLNVYRQFLGSKGTILSAELFSQANLGKESADYNIYENWAVQRAVYGANANRSFFQLRLNRALLDSNPSVVQVVYPQQASPADQAILVSNIWRESYKITSPDILPVTTTLPTDSALPTAGYVNLDDVDITVFDINDTFSLQANLNDIGVGTNIWVAKINSFDWAIYRAQAVPGIIAHVCDNLDGTSLVIFTAQHGLTVNDKLIVRFFDAEVDGVYTVLTRPSLDKVTIAFSFTGDRTVVNGVGIGFTLETQRVAQASDVLNLPYANTIKPGAKVWVDNNGADRWTVLQKQQVFSGISELAPVEVDEDEQYGSAIAQAQNRAAALVGSPRYRFPPGATQWNIANNYATNDIVFVLDPVQTEFFQAAQPVPNNPPVPVTDTAYWNPYSLASLPRHGGVYVYVKSDTNTYAPISALAPLDAVLTLDQVDVSGGAFNGQIAARGYGSSVDFGNQTWAAAGAPNSLGSTGLVDNGYATVIYRDPQLATPGQIPYGQWQLLTSPVSRTAAEEFGHSVSISLDERWLYIGAPGANSVYAYGRVDWEKQRVQALGNGVTTTYAIGNIIQIDANTQLTVSVSGQEQFLGTDYTVIDSLTAVQFITPPAAGDAVEIFRTSRQALDYQTYFNVASTCATGSGATFAVTRTRGTVTVLLSSGGSGYVNGISGAPSANSITIPAVNFGGGSSPANDITVTVTVSGGVVTGISGTATYTAPALATVFSLNEYLYTADNIYSFSVLVNNVLQRPDIDYTFSSATQDLTFVNSPTAGASILVRAEGYFEYVDTLAYAGSAAGDRFGSAVSTSTDGRQILIGGQDVEISGTILSVTAVGNAAAGSATYTNVAQNSTSGVGIGARFTVSKFNSAYTVTVTDPGQDYASNDTVTISGSALGGATTANNLIITVTGIDLFSQAGAVYVYDRNVQRFIYGTDGSTITFTVLGTVSAPVSVLVNNVFLTNVLDAAPGVTDTFAVSGNTVTINGDLYIGDKIEIETNAFSLVQTISQNTVAEFSNYGHATDLCQYNCSLYVGAPNSSVQNFKGGVVERSINQSRAYGIITALIANPTLTSGNTIRVNNQDVVVPSAWSSVSGYSTNSIVYYYSAATTVTTIYLSLQTVAAGTALTNQSYWNTVTSTSDTASGQIRALAAQINTSVSNVNATVDVAGYLTLAVKNSAAAPVGDKLQVAPGSIGTTFDDIGFDTFVFTQTVLSPYPVDFAGFGSSLNIDNTAVNLVVGSPRGTLYLITVFDVTTDTDNNTIETDFDEGATDFFDQTIQSGAVYTYDLLSSSSSSVANPDKFVFGQQISSAAIASYDQYGTAVNYTDGVLFTGAPGNEFGDSTLSSNYGRVFVSVNDTRLPAWTALRVQQPVVDVRLLNSVYTYDSVTSAVTQYFDFFNPLQGKILGAARQNLDYIGAVNPASYNVGPVNIRGTTWGMSYLGVTWWDTSTVRFIDPGQDDIVYASRRWGQLFPGSTVDVYQWIVSAVPPSSYTGEGIPYDTVSYVVNTVLSQAGIFNTEYYFWVRGITATATQKGKTLSVSTVANYIENPRASGITYIAPINASTIALYNAADSIQAEDTVISIEFDKELNNDNVHVEYELIAQDKADAWLSNNLYRKLQDSFCGVDTAGNLVPDVNLNPAERYGVQFRPRQSMFVNRLAALRNYLVRANTVLAQFTISENRTFVLLNSSELEPSATTTDNGLTTVNWNKRVADLEILGFQQLESVPVGYKYLVATDSTNRGLWTIYQVIQTIQASATVRTLQLERVQNFNTRQYWSYINWYLPGYNSSSKLIAEVPNFSALATLNVAIGSSVKVTANGQGKFEIYIRTAIGWDRVGLQDGTIAFSAELWDYALGRFGFDVEVFDAQYFDQEPVIETRKIIQAINEELFIDDLLLERNRALTLMFNFVLSELGAPEWLVKTSLIDVEHRIRALLPFQNYSRDNQEFVLDYIQEVKPYHVSIREFNLRYNGNDEYFGNMTDFDLPAYYNTAVQIPQFTSPVLLPYDHGSAFNTETNNLSDLSASSTVWADFPYNQWYNNHLLAVDSIVIVQTGSAYSSPPLVIITANPGDSAPTQAAAATAVLNGAGQVVAVNITNSGAGYTSTATVTFDGGNGSGARAYARMYNDVVRQFRTVIRYDRYQYQSSVQTWSVDGTYENGTLARYDNRVWAAANADGSSAVVGPTFDLENWQEVNAATYAYPGSDQPTGLTGVDRTMGLYVPGVNSPGLDLPLLVDGVDYPGVQVWGDYFTGTQRRDADYQSQFADIYLGTRYSDINIDGGEFVGTYEGHAPEELVNGAEYDSMDMRIYTRPGSDWTFDGHGFQVNTVRYVYDSAIADVYSWAYVVQNAYQIIVTNLNNGRVLNQDIDYVTDWADQTITIISNVANGELISIDVYEIGGGSQLYRGNFVGADVSADNNTLLVPVSYAQMVQTDVFINGQLASAPELRPYTASVIWNLNNTYQRLDIVFNNNVLTVTNTDGVYNTVTCANTSALTVGQPIVFSGTGFGGIVPAQEYYVQAIANGTQFLISTVAGTVTPVALTTASGVMTGQPQGAYYRAIQTVIPGIALINTNYWLPFVPTQRTLVTIPNALAAADGIAVLVLGDASSIPVNATLAVNNSVVLTGSVAALYPGQTVTFFGYSLGGVQTHTDYQILYIDAANDSITLTTDGSTPVVLIDDQAVWTGELVAKFVASDYRSWSTPVTQTFIVDNAIRATGSVTLSAVPSGTNAANMIVNVNGIRLVGPSDIEWIGDDTTASFGLPQRLGASFLQSSIYAPLDIQVYVNNQLQKQSFGAEIGTYSVSNWSGSNTPGRQVIFDTAPESGAQILIAVSTLADVSFAYDAAAPAFTNQLQIVPLLNIGDVLEIITWNNTGQQNICTLTFQGPVTISGALVVQEYDTTDYDSPTLNNPFEPLPGQFDLQTGTTILSNEFDLLRINVIGSRLWVTLDGVRLVDGKDFVISGQYLILAAGTINNSQQLIVTEFTNSTVPDAVEFRIFQDMRGIQATYRMTTASTTVLVQDLSATADMIYVDNAAALSEPDLPGGVFGLITIGGERIMYRTRDTVTNAVSGLLRGTAGTAASNHFAADTVYDIGRGNLLSAAYQDYVVSDSTLADGSTTVYYAPSINISDFGDSSSIYTESIEVYVGGQRQYNYSQTQAQSTYRYIVTDFGPLAVEFIVDNDPVSPLLPPAAGSEVTIMQRRGVSWYEYGTATASNGLALQETNTAAARFLCAR